MKRPFRNLKNYFFPHQGNAHKPGFFKKDSVIAVAAVLVFLTASYFAVTTIVFHKTSFLAAVLPGVLTTLANEDRTQHGLGTLTRNPLLAKAAEIKAADMAAKGYFSHVTPDGKTPWYWLDKVGYNYTYAGENLAVNFTDSKDVEIAWMNSPAHRANILRGQFTQIGIGTADGMYQGKPVTFVVQFFGRPAPTNTASSAVSAAVKSDSTAAPTPPNELATSGTPSPQVLGADIGPVPPTAQRSLQESFLIAFSSPNQTTLYIVGGIIALIVVLLSLAIFVKIRVQYLEVIGGGIILLALASASFVSIETHVSNPVVPTDSESASVTSSL